MSGRHLFIKAAHFLRKIKVAKSIPVTLNKKVELKPQVKLNQELPSLPSNISPLPRNLNTKQYAHLRKNHPYSLQKRTLITLPVTRNDYSLFLTFDDILNPPPSLVIQITFVDKYENVLENIGKAFNKNADFDYYHCFPIHYARNTAVVYFNAPKNSVKAHIVIDNLDYKKNSVSIKNKIVLFSNDGLSLTYNLKNQTCAFYKKYRKILDARNPITLSDKRFSTRIHVIPHSHYVLSIQYQRDGLPRHNPLYLEVVFYNKENQIIHFENTDSQDLVPQPFKCIVPPANLVECLSTLDFKSPKNAREAQLSFYTEKPSAKSISFDKITLFGSALSKIFIPDHTHPVTDDAYVKNQIEYTQQQREKIYQIIPSIANSHASKWLTSFNITIGIISDEFIFEAYKPFANLTYLTPSNYEGVLSENNIEVVIITATLSGLDEQWQGCRDQESTIVKSIAQIKDICKSKGITVIYQTLEDPFLYKDFLWLAKLADVIFTTTAELVDKYKESCGNDKVFVCSPGVNPFVHNPIGRASESVFKETVFSSVTETQLHKNDENYKVIFDGVLDTGKALLIIDQKSNEHESESPYQAKYQPYITKLVSNNDLVKLPKLFDWAITLNEVMKSKTMFAFQNYELQASGNLLLSNFSSGISQLFPNIFIILERDNINAIINHLDPVEKRLLSNNGIRNVMSDHTYHARLAQLLSLAQIKDIPLVKPRVAVILEKDSTALHTMFNRQSYTNKTCFIEKCDESTYQHYDIICFFGETHDYGVFYLEDMINAFNYTNCDFITKNVYQTGGLFSNRMNNEGFEHQFTDHFSDKYRTLFWRHSYHYDELFLSNSSQDKNRHGYSADAANYCHQPIPIQAIARHYKFSLVMPVYNNYKHIIRALISLKSEAYFSEIEIIVVDDGSTDNITPHVLKEYQLLYPNISCYFYEQGGSGSASRPRNKGVELATTPYVTFLDPDNAGTGEYSNLYDEIVHDNQLDFVFGHILQVTTKVKKIFHYSRTFEISDPRAFFVNSGFRTYSVQSAMYKKDFLVQNEISNVVGCIGEDTLFAYETFLKAKKAKYINKAIHLYYLRIDSLTRTIDANFFKKHIGVEKKTRAIFEKAGLYDLFIKIKHASFVEEWYFKKLNKVTIHDPLIKSYLRELLTLHSGLDVSLSENAIEQYKIIFS